MYGMTMCLHFYGLQLFFGSVTGPHYTGILEKKKDILLQNNPLMDLINLKNDTHKITEKYPA